MARVLRWLWAVPALGLLTSCGQLGRVVVTGSSFEPTDDTLYTRYVLRPYVRAAVVGLLVSLVVLILLRVLARRQVRAAALVGLACLSPVVLAGADLVAAHASHQRRHPDPRLLAALAAVPADPGWTVRLPPVVRRDGFVLPPEVAAPTGLEERTAGSDVTQVCATLARLLRGWTPSGSPCSWRRTTHGVLVSVWADDRGVARQVVVHDVAQVDTSG